MPHAMTGTQLTLYNSLTRSLEAFQPLDPAHSLAFSEYGQSFAAVVGKGSCYGVQFHPEKSQRLGRRLLENFLGLTPC